MEYLDALEREMELTVNAATRLRRLKRFSSAEGRQLYCFRIKWSVFYAGSHIFSMRDQRWQIEFSMEANPGTTDEDKLAVMKAGGVNRISFGVQSFNNEMLACDWAYS